MKLLLIALICFSCASDDPSVMVESALAYNVDTRQQATDIDIIVDKAIETKQTQELVYVKPKTDKIRSNSIELDSLVFDFKNYQEKTDAKIKELEDKTSFRTYLPWFILFAGIGSALIGRFVFNSVGATIGGGVVACLSVAVNQYYDHIAKFGGAILLLFVAYIVGAVIIKHEQVVKRKD